MTKIQILASGADLGPAHDLPNDPGHPGDAPVKPDQMTG